VSTIAIEAPEPVQIAQAMGLPRPRTYDEFKLAELIRQGVPAKSAENVARTIDPAGDRLRASDLVPRTSLHRAARVARPLSTDASETLWQVARVFVEARRHYGDGNAAMAFLFRPNAVLGGRRPFDLARETAAGADVVMRLLAQAEASVAI